MLTERLVADSLETKANTRRSKGKSGVLPRCANDRERRIVSGSYRAACLFYGEEQMKHRVVAGKFG